jgi:hypothetical protein
MDVLQKGARPVSVKHRKQSQKSDISQEMSESVLHVAAVQGMALPSNIAYLSARKLQ